MNPAWKIFTLLLIYTVNPATVFAAEVDEAPTKSMRPVCLYTIGFKNSKGERSIQWLNRELTTKIQESLDLDFKYESKNIDKIRTSIFDIWRRNPGDIRVNQMQEIAISNDCDFVVYGQYRKTGFQPLQDLLDQIPLTINQLELDIYIFFRPNNEVIYEKSYNTSMDKVLTSDLNEIARDLKDAIADYFLKSKIYQLTDHTDDNGNLKYALVKEEVTTSESPFFFQLWWSSQVSATFANTEALGVSPLSAAAISTNYNTYFNPSYKFRKLLARATYLDNRYKNTVFGTDFTQVINIYFLVYSTFELIDVSLFVNNLRMLYLTAGSDTLQTIDELDYFSHKQVTVNRLRIVYYFWVRTPI